MLLTEETTATCIFFLPHIIQDNLKLSCYSRFKHLVDIIHLCISEGLIAKFLEIKTAPLDLLSIGMVWLPL